MSDCWIDPAVLRSLQCFPGNNSFAEALCIVVGSRPRRPGIHISPQNVVPERPPPEDIVKKYCEELKSRGPSLMESEGQALRLKSRSFSVKQIHEMLVNTSKKYRETLKTNRAGSSNNPTDGSNPVVMNQADSAANAKTRILEFKKNQQLAAQSRLSAPTKPVTLDGGDLKLNTGDSKMMISQFDGADDDAFEGFEDLSDEEGGGKEAKKAPQASPATPAGQNLQAGKKTPGFKTITMDAMNAGSVGKKGTISMDAFLAVQSGSMRGSNTLVFGGGAVGTKPNAVPTSGFVAPPKNEVMALSLEEDDNGANPAIKPDGSLSFSLPKKKEVQTPQKPTTVTFGQSSNSDIPSSTKNEQGATQFANIGTTSQALGFGAFPTTEQEPAPYSFSAFGANAQPVNFGSLPKNEQAQAPLPFGGCFDSSKLGEPSDFNFSSSRRGIQPRMVPLGDDSSDDELSNIPDIE